MALVTTLHICKIFSIKTCSPTIGNVRHIKRCVRPTLASLNKRSEIYRRELGEEKWLDMNRRSKFLEWNRSAEVYAFGKRLQEDFRLDLLDQAFIHRSYTTKEKLKMDKLQVKSDEFELTDNTGLVVIGEKIISDHVWNYFSHFFPRFPLEGIEAVHKYLTSDKVLGHVSENIGTTHIILSADYPILTETYAVTLKAIVGALMESQGIKKSNNFVRDLIITRFSGEDINDFLIVDDYFKVLCEILARDGIEAPEPRIICSSGVNTILNNYHVGIYSNRELLGHFSGETQDIAVQMASFDVLKRLFHTTDWAKPLRYDAELPYEGKIQNNLPLSEWSISSFNGSKR